jgi:hypothetical protein
MKSVFSLACGCLATACIFSGTLIAEEPAVTFPSFVASARRSLVLLPKDDKSIDAMEVYVLASKLALDKLEGSNALKLPLPSGANGVKLLHGLDVGAKLEKENVVYTGGVRLGQNQFSLAYTVAMGSKPFRFEPGRVASPHPVEVFVPKGGVLAVTVEGASKLEDEVLPAADKAPQAFEHYVGHAGLSGAPSLVVVFHKQGGKSIHPGLIIAGGIVIGLLLLLAFRARSRRRGMPLSS